MRENPVLVVLGLTVVVLPYALLALGEELGWRGLVVTRLAQVARPRAVVRHRHVHHALTAFSAILAGMQLRWGVWPVSVAHAVGNATLYRVLQPVTLNGSSRAWFST